MPNQILCPVMVTLIRRVMYSLCIEHELACTYHTSFLVITGIVPILGAVTPSATSARLPGHLAHYRGNNALGPTTLLVKTLLQTGNIGGRNMPSTHLCFPGFNGAS